MKTRLFFAAIVAAIASFTLIAFAQDTQTPSATNQTETEGEFDFKTRQWPDLLQEYKDTLSPLTQPLAELRKTYFIFYIAAFEDDLETGLSLLADEIYDFGLDKTITKDEIRKRDEKTKTPNPHALLSKEEKVTLIKNDLKFFEIEFYPYDEMKDLGLENFGNITLQENDYLVRVKAYPEDDGLLFVMRVIDGYWTIIAGGMQ